MSKRANIKGFRPGKVPVHHLKRVYGKSAMAEVVQNAIDDQSKALLEEKKLKPAYQPEVKLPEDQAEVNAIMDGKGDLSFSVALEVIPDFDVKDHSGLELTRHVVEVTEDQIDETLKRIASPVQELRGEGRRRREGRPRHHQLRRHHRRHRLRGRHRGGRGAGNRLRPVHPRLRGPADRRQGR